jgi:hypothetical protein
MTSDCRRAGLSGLAVLTVLVAFTGARPAAVDDPPRDWIDADTGHRVVRLTDDAGGSTLYFHDNAFSPDGGTMMINTPTGICRLVNMSRHNYVTGRGGVEPNVHITPDKKWVVFTGQFAPGQRHVYAVAIAK